jgi:hypothetical protein
MDQHFGKGMLKNRKTFVGEGVSDEDNNGGPPSKSIKIRGVMDRFGLIQPALS